MDGDGSPPKRARDTSGDREMSNFAFFLNAGEPHPPSRSVGPCSFGPRARENLSRDVRYIGNLLLSLGCHGADVAELFGDGKFIRKAPKLGLMPSTAMDLRTGWDFSNPADRRRARLLMDEEEPMLLVGSPMCRAHRPLQALNEGRRKDPAAFERFKR